MVKQFKILVFLFISLLILGSCGKTGKDGKAYLSIDWDDSVYYYSDNCSGVPSSIQANTYYEVEPGTYNYTYDYTDINDNSWEETGTFTITNNKGKEGGLIFNGADGEDTYFDLYLYAY